MKDSEAKRSLTSTTTRNIKSPEPSWPPVVTDSIFGPGGVDGEGFSRIHDDHIQDIREGDLGGNTNVDCREASVDRNDGASSSIYDAGTDVGGGPDCDERTSGSGEQYRYLMSDPFLELIKDDGSLPDVQAERMDSMEEVKGPLVVPEISDTTPTTIANCRLCACFAREGTTNRCPSGDHGAI